MVAERVSRDVEELKHSLSVFTRLCSSLRNARVRNEDQIAVCQHEVHEIRKALGYSQPRFGIAQIITLDEPFTKGELRDADRWEAVLDGAA